MADRIRVLIVDDHPVVLQGIEAMLSNHEDIEVVSQASNGSLALHIVEKLAPDVVLLDIRMPACNGVQIAKRMKHTFEWIKIIMLTTYEEDEHLFGALEAGVEGYLLKTISSEKLIDAIRTVASGGCLLSPTLVGRVLRQFKSVTEEKVRLESGLTSQELTVLESVASGATNKEIAEMQYLSEITVKRKLQDIIRKLDATDRTHAVAEGIRRGLI